MKKKGEITEPKTWYEKHKNNLTFSQKLTDKLAKGMGSWTFIIIQSVFIMIWVIINFVGYIKQWDPYPFILLNLLFSVQAAYAAPIIMMAQNRQNDSDRHAADDHYKSNIETTLEIEIIHDAILSLENEKIDKIIQLLEDMKKDVY